MLKYDVNLNELVETEYEIQNEQQAASLLTTGNGYFGVRGSFEEYATIGVQGSYIRGLLDEIYELPNISIDNIYMRKYYFDEEKARYFEKQESCINYCDFLLLRFTVGKYTFFPWEGKIISWKRYIDTSSGSLIRTVLWEDPEENRTEFTFKRTASFSNNHIYLMEAKAKRINHTLPIQIASGVDVVVKTNQQIRTQLNNYFVSELASTYVFDIGEKYNSKVGVCINHNISVKEYDLNYIEENGRFMHIFGNINDDEVEINKMIYVSSSIDDEAVNKSENFYNEHIDMINDYHLQYKNHLNRYQTDFALIDIQIKGNDNDDALLRYANYQTLIGLDRFDQVHSVSAKNLTSDKYNQFVWWDAEIYQLPLFFVTYPEAAKNCLMYRYNRLEAAKENAIKEGYRGAKFAFCSGKTGEELVWPYARHPFLQIHINTDIAYAILRYYETTKDIDFLKKYGMEIITEILRYFMSRVTFNLDKNQYELNNVTGTDEHHPYVNNNTYTNYMLKHVIKTLLNICNNSGILIHKYFSEDEMESLKHILKHIYIQKPVNGIIPQFDDYLSLNPELEITGKGAAKGFQMKASGLYHLSQVIKQPDLLMLYTYCNVDFDKDNYIENWHYYEEKCESSSSLSYPVHAISAIDNGEMDKFYKYYKQALRIDIDDLHNGAHQGLHAACMAGGRYAIYRGLFGVKERLNYLEIKPKKQNFYEEVSLQLIYQSKEVHLKLTQTELLIKSDKPIDILLDNKLYKQIKYKKYRISR